jgi:hypothetical protein
MANSVPYSDTLPGAFEELSVYGRETLVVEQGRALLDSTWSQMDIWEALDAVK